MIGSFKYGWFKVDSTAPSSILYTKYTYSYEIQGSAFNNNFGTNVSINSAGDVWATGSMYYNSFAGIISIKRGNNNLGSIIGGSNASVGKTMSMNSSGSRVVTFYYIPGSGGIDSNQTRVYRHNGGTTWVQLGQDIGNIVPATHLTMNGDGNVYAASYSTETVGGNANSGATRVFELSTHPLTANIWVQRGNTINGLSGSRLGACSINKAGNILAVGAPYANNISTLAGSVSTFEWNGASWNIKGNPLFGLEKERFGFSVALNYEGNRLAIGVIGRTSTAGGSGQVLVYDWDGSNWSQLGTPIQAPLTGNVSFGSSISMNAVGDLVIIGAPSTNINGQTLVGSTHIFQWYQNNWVNYVPVISGSASDQLGISVAMDGVGNNIVIGNPGYDSGGINQRGRVIYYNLS
jgi:hypothetical protein